MVTFHSQGNRQSPSSRLPRQVEVFPARRRFGGDGQGLLSPVQGARALGWASLGIAALEIFAPRQVQRLLGTEDQPNQRGVLRVMGVRELMHGLAILSQRRPTAEMQASVWSRVAGDALDTALLAMAARQTKRPGRFAVVAATVAGIGVLDIVHSLRLQKQRSQR